MEEAQIKKYWHYCVHMAIKWGAQDEAEDFAQFATQLKASGDPGRIYLHFVDYLRALLGRPGTSKFEHHSHLLKCGESLSEYSSYNPVEDIERALDLQTLFNCLSSQERELFMHLYEGGTQREMAARLGVHETRMSQLVTELTRRLNAGYNGLRLRERGQC